MRILLLNDDFPPRGRGGGATVVRDLAQGYAKAGHDVTVITTHQDSTSIEERKDYDVTVISLPIRYRKSLRWYLSLKNRKTVKLLQKTLERLPPFEIVHVHNIHFYLSYESIVIAKQHAKKVIVTFHDVMSVSCARLTTKRYLASTPPDFDYRITMLDRMKQCGLTWNPLREKIIRKALQCADVRIAVSGALKNLLAANGIRADRVIHNGVDTLSLQSDESVTASTTEHFHLTGKRTVFFGGRLSHDKGLCELLRAFAPLGQSYPDVRILIVGDEARAKKLLEACQEATMIRNQLIVTGWLERKELLALMSASECVVTPSVCFDSFPTVNLEAMVLAKPVIATIFGGSSELVDNGVTGFLINPLDTSIFKKHLETLLSNPSLAKNMGQKGKERVMQKYTLQQQVTEYLTLANH